MPISRLPLGSRSTRNRWGELHHLCTQRPRAQPGSKVARGLAGAPRHRRHSWVADRRRHGWKRCDYPSSVLDPGLSFEGDLHGGLDGPLCLVRAVPSSRRGGRAGLGCCPLEATGLFNNHGRDCGAQRTVARHCRASSVGCVCVPLMSCFLCSSMLFGCRGNNE